MTVLELRKFLEACPNDYLVMVRDLKTDLVQEVEEVLSIVKDKESLRSEVVALGYQPD